VQLLAMGAHGYVPHAEVSRALVRAIFLVAANEFWVPHDAFIEFLREAASVLRKDARDSQITTPLGKMRFWNSCAFASQTERLPSFCKSA
jgi:hypothetical protein